MIGKITAPRGERVQPLIYYLYGPAGGRSTQTRTSLPAGGTPLNWSRRCVRTAPGTSAHCWGC